MKKLKIKTEMLRRNGPVMEPWSQFCSSDGSRCRQSVADLVQTAIRDEKEFVPVGVGGANCT